MTAQYDSLRWPEEYRFARSNRFWFEKHFIYRRYNTVLSWLLKKNVLWMGSIGDAHNGILREWLGMRKHW